MNFVNVILFQAEVVPDKLAIVAHGSIIPYGRLASGILSVQKRLSAIGLSAGQTVGISVAHPIDHLVVACALYRMKIASASINAAADIYLDNVPFDVVLADNALPTVSVKQPTARMVLIDPSWFQDQTASTVTQRTTGHRDTETKWVSRIVCYPHSDGSCSVVRTSAQLLEAQLQTYCISAPPLWDRMISIAGVQSNAGFLQAISALSLGRSVCFTDVYNVRSLSLLYRHDYLVAPIELVEPLLKLQEADYAALHGLRAACFEGSASSTSVMSRSLTMICSNLLFRYTHPETGIVAYGDVSRFKAVEGAVGFVAPWIEAQVISSSEILLPAGQEGTLRFRPRVNSGYGASDSSRDDDWNYPARRAVIMANQLLVIRPS
ncbi:MAG: hypothetical protein J0I13_02230 [Rhizobiales bacterium]|nr:hypothetical protein [Hyphomicrobiales bacterium]